MSENILGKRIRATCAPTGREHVIVGEVVGAEATKGDGWILLVKTADKLENIAVYFWDVMILEDA